jgi:nucleoside-diphosphate-sugar epimerase
MAMSIFVLGGSGVIGREIVSRLLEESTRSRF